MTDIIETPLWENGISMIKRGEKVEGGIHGPANRQARQLANRTLFLKKIIESNFDSQEFTFYPSAGDESGENAGLSSTKDGQLFRVAHATGEYSFIYYLNNSGVAVPVAFMSNGKLTVELFRDFYNSSSYLTVKKIPRGPSDIRWGVISGEKWLIAVNKLGEFISSHSHDKYEEIFRTLANPELVNKLTGTTKSKLPRGPKGVIDGLIVGGAYVWYLDENGMYVDGRQQSIGESVYTPSLVIIDVFTGQSLALGSRGFINTVPGGGLSGEVFSSAPSQHGNLCLMLKGVDSAGNKLGVRVFVNNDTYVPPEITDFTGIEPMYERWDGGVVGQTICSSYADALMTALKKQKNVRFRLLPIVSAKGASKYASLKKGSNVWQAMFNAIDAAREIIEEQGMIYRAGDLDVTHGEAELYTGQAVYEGYCREWLSDFRDDVILRTGQSRRSIKMTYSQCNTGGLASEGVASAQVNLHETDPDFILYCPKYQFPRYDAQHLLAEGYVKVGELRARARRFMLGGRKWDCLRPVSAALAGTTLTIRFNNMLNGGDDTPGPIGKLVLDTERGVNTDGCCGFYISDTNVSVTSVTTGGDGVSVILSLSTAPVAGSVVKYAIGEAGAGGAVRDSDERDRSSYDSDYLYNFSVGKVLEIK
ncbi:hypothetical protein [Entomohabitans teleogrylli]|uniref:hypothetical protein n=1 Tax=Entomohabitans teleogrylli TaxID=1384589 RepID=UPI00073D41BF|nr:hypothetical protein [Entomohabitans teleogrylli]